jgi:hypothetical protein
MDGWLANWYPVLALAPRLAGSFGLVLLGAGDLSWASQVVTGMSVAMQKAVLYTMVHETDVCFSRVA